MEKAQEILIVLAGLLQPGVLYKDLKKDKELLKIYEYPQTSTDKKGNYKVISYLIDYIKESKNPDEIYTAYSIIIEMFNKGNKQFRLNLTKCKKH